MFVQIIESGLERKVSLDLAMRSDILSNAK
nr:MAG TPA: hypothetical protein [Caudoviricetes sp.]